MSAFCVHDHIRFSTLTPEGPVTGSGEILKILPAGKSHWLHVRQNDGSVRMLFEATTQAEALELEAA